MAGAEFVGVNLRDGCHQTLKERFFGHFQAEDGHGKPGANGDIFGEVESQGGLPLRGAGGEDNQLGGLKARGQLVELAVAGGCAGDALALAKDFFQALEVGVDDFLHRDETDADTVFGEGEDRRFGAVEDAVGALLAFKGALLDGVSGVNQVAKERLLFDDADVMLDVGGTRHTVHE